MRFFEIGVAWPVLPRLAMPVLPELPRIADGIAGIPATPRFDLPRICNADMMAEIERTCAPLRSMVEAMRAAAETINRAMRSAELAERALPQLADSALSLRRI